LSYQLLKLVNSVAFSPTQKVTSFSQAIALLGRRQLQRWLQLLLYTRAQGSTVASPLLPRAALRASLMEGLAKRIGLSNAAQDEAFMVGMFSLLDVLFGMPLQDVVVPLNLPDEVVQALTAGSGELGELKAIVLAAENAPSVQLATALGRFGIANAAWAAELVKAYGWAIQVGKEA
jgi:EAL and modified HD-GYP domain-containing signal transduction protein